MDKPHAQAQLAIIDAGLREGVKLKNVGWAITFWPFYERFGRGGGQALVLLVFAVNSLLIACAGITKLTE